LADWRDGEDHLDAAAGSPHSLAYLQAGVEGGEGFDWHYASEADRIAQRRTPITDGAHGEPWIWRYKDVRSWWSMLHHDRRGGVRSVEPTAWVPMSKPVWFTEFGCPAVDKGANQPNVFHDPKSSESALPWFSDGTPDHHMQRRYLQAVTDYWSDPARNPVSPIYGGPMISMDRCFAWTWDLRPWPDFPLRREVWADGDNHRLGHWLTGRTASAGLAETVAEICLEAGVRDVDVSGLQGVLPGYQQTAVQSARSALQPLMLAFGFDAVETGGKVRFVQRGARPAMVVDPADCVAPGHDRPATLAVTRAAAADAPDAVRFGYLAADGAYETATVEARFAQGVARVEAAAASLALDAATASLIAARWLSEARLAGDEAIFALPPSAARLEPGDVVAAPFGPRQASFRVERIEDRGERRVLARRSDRPAPSAVAATAVAAPRLRSVEPVEALAFEAPDAEGLRVAVWADPWAGPVAVFDERAETLAAVATIHRPAAAGLLVAPAAGTAATVRQEGRGLLAQFTARPPGPGSGLAALLHQEGVELFHFERAEPVDADVYRLSGLLRGLHGTEFLAAAPLAAETPLVVLDDAVATLAWGTTPLGGTRRLRCVPAHLPPDHHGARAVSVARADPALRPLSVAHLRATPDEDGAVTLAWVRRTRDGGDAWGEVEPPLAEETERYRVRVLSGDRTLRIEDTSSPAFVYTAAMRRADATQGPLIFAVSQLSARFGPGVEKRIAVDAG
ncbi:MAG: glycoside hydrolase TIM-barrel-like domain-containing protein, partial [Rubrimonas sp.]